MLGYTDIFNQRGRSYSLAMKSVNHARFFERDLLMQKLNLKLGDRFLDVPSGEGYLAEAAYQITPNVICLEPTFEFSSQIAKNFKVISSPLDQMDIANEDVDAIGSLAGLHHLPLLQLKSFFDECFRVLQHGGTLAIAEVEKGTQIDYFLNHIVDKYSETGHNGHFFSEQDFNVYLDEAGFKNIEARRQDFHWIFDDIRQMLYFVKNLFGLTKLQEPELLHILDQTLGFFESDRKIKLNWSLIYASANK